MLCIATLCMLSNTMCDKNLVSEKGTPSHLSCLSLHTATMTSRFPRMLISMTRDRKQIRAMRFGMLALGKWQKNTTTV